MTDVKRELRKFIKLLNGSSSVDALRLHIEEQKATVEALKHQISDNADYIKELAHSVRGHEKNQASISRAVTDAGLEKITTRDKTKRAVYILSTHDFGNIGDLAIGYTEKVFLRDIFKDNDLYEVSRLTLLSNWQQIRQSITDKDIIVLPGGGNIGDIWPAEESSRRKIIETYVNNKIIIFPQSIKFYDKDELALSSEVYNNHGHLMLAVRDDTSYDIAKKYFQACSVIRTQDIVLSYVYPATDSDAKDAIAIVARSDKEKSTTGNIEKVIGLVKNKYETFVTDTVDNDYFGLDGNSAAYLTYLKTDQLRTSRLVITDRLHAAVFALHAGRPVIVFDNNYGKIKGALKDTKKHYAERILFANTDGSNVTLEVIDKMYNLPQVDTPPAAVFAKDFAVFAKEITEFSKQK